ncbi:hypothetical protein FHW84_004038 [Dyella sp. SG562]|uniref:hypothetical protein n=1 Tax=Dyella TaxID=231454 RepID=UPI001421EEF0|nr:MULTISPECIES: hypothetical protein [unclassified Dyella]NII75428.1 hypothetical protein [Dyella sp. SG562]NKJ23548.1 hypothetical protein [Dyella sp. SG609]
MNKSKPSSLKRVVLAAAVLLGCAAAAPSFARSHVSVGIGVNLPGVSIGYSDGYRGHYRHPYYGGGYYAGGYYAPPVYYRPAPRVVYYDEPVVVERPVYVRRVYEERGYYSDGYRTSRYYDGD